MLTSAADRLAAHVGAAWKQHSGHIKTTAYEEKLLDRRAETLVVVGNPGAGKTALAYRYLRIAMERRRPGDPVPVWCLLDKWHAGTPVTEWLIDCLSASLPSESRFDRTVIAALVGAGLVHPIIDGVDKLAVGLRSEFLDGVRALRFPVLLTSRPIDFGARFPVVGLRPPALHTTLRRWPAIADAVREDPFGPLAVALSDPVNRYLFDSRYAETEADPAVLLDRTLLPDARSVERHLVAESEPEVLHLIESLGHMARTADEAGAAWWRLADSVPRSVFVIVALLGGGLIAVEAQAAAAEVLTQLGAPLPSVATRLVVGVASGLAAGAWLLWATRPRRPVAVGWRGLPASSWLWAVSSVVVGIAVGVTVTVLGDASMAVPGFSACVFAGWLSWLRMAAVSQTEDRMESPLSVLRRDRTVAYMRLFFTVFIIAGLLNVIVGPEVTEGLATGALVWTVALLAASKTAYVRYKLAGFAPTQGRLVRDAVGRLNTVPTLVRREGGVYRFRDESVRNRIVMLNIEPVGIATTESAAQQVSLLRHELVERACKKAEVRRVLDNEAYQHVTSEIAEQVTTKVDLIVTFTSVARRQYLASKARYAEKVLGKSWKPTVRVASLTGNLAVVGAASSTFGAAVLVPDLIGGRTLESSWTLAGPVALIVLVRWGLRRRWGWRRWWNSTVRRVFTGVMLGDLAGVAWWALPNLALPKPLVWSICALGFLMVILGVATKNTRLRVAALRSDDPALWPPDHVASWAGAERAQAVLAHREWIDALVERGVLPLVTQHPAVVAKPSYATRLPKADVRRLGEVADVEQYVPTETSRRLLRMMDSMSRGAIGISGPRGVGKSTVLKMFSELRFGARPDDVALVVHAPTNYGSREFLAHLYATLCEKVIGEEPDQRPRVRSRPWLLASLTGGLVALGGWQWPWLVRAAAWVPQHWRTLVVTAGVTAVVVSLLGLWMTTARSRRRPGDPIVREARRRLEGLRFVETTTVTRTVTVKPPAVADVAGAHARARAGQIKTLPELVAEFRAFLVLLTGRTPGARVVVCVDELDKIASDDEAERFLNDIKAVFGVEGCFFLVAVSHDALATFSRRSLAVRTALDSAFDSVVTVQRFEVADTRQLLVQRVARLPEPFVWLCHALSGGLPRDLNRTVRDLYDLHSAHDERELGTLALKLIHADLEAVTDGLSTRLADRFDSFAVRLRRHIVDVRRLELTSGALMDYELLEVPEDASDDLLLVYEQFRAYLAYASALLAAFREDTAAMVAKLKDTEP